MSCRNLADIAAQFTPALVRRVTYHPWLGSWVPHVVLSYPQWDLKEVTYEAPILGQLAWLVGGHPTCPGCGSPVDIATIPALMALCPQCFGRVAQESWVCCEQVTKGQAPLCNTPLRSPPCIHSSPRSPVPLFAITPPCLELHELVALWFAPGRARVCVLPSSRASTAIAASGAIVARRYQISHRVAFLEDWEAILGQIRDSTFSITVNFHSIPSHNEISEESLASVEIFAGTSSNASEDLAERSQRELFDPLEAILCIHHASPREESWAHHRYFLPQRLPRRRSTLEALSDSNLLALLGTGVGAWGPWFFLRKLDGTIAQLNLSALLGRLVADSPMLLAGQEIALPSRFKVEFGEISTAGGEGLVPPESSVAGAGSFPDPDGGE